MTDIRFPLGTELANKTRAAEKLLERFAAQVAFGRWLCGTTPDKAGEWKAILDAAEKRFAPVFLSGSDAEAAAALADAESTFGPMTGKAATHTVYCVGHAHIDMNWMWSWPETVAVTNDTFTSVLRLMEEFPSFVFSQSQASVYQIIEKYNPPMLERIAGRIKEGRWEVTASHWVETEKNIVSAESLCRHILYTRNYMHELFGLEPEDVRIDWSPDTFGHAVTVPTYLAKAEVEYLYLHRPGAHGQQPRPRAFWWDGPDGSRVLTWNDMAFGYNGQIKPQVLLRSLAETHGETALPFTMFVYGVGDHGGGPTRRDLLNAVEMNSWPLFPSIEFSKAETFYDRLKAEGAGLPVLNSELNFEFTGCYTSQSLIKKANRFAEKKLVAAETASTIAAAAAGTRYPFKIYEEGWRNTLFNHFHDIIPGSGVRDTRTHAHGLYQETVAGTGVNTALALRALAARIDTAGGAPSPIGRSLAAGVGRGAADGGMSEYEYFSADGIRYLMLFNPLPYARDEIVESTMWEGFEPWTDQESVAFSVTSPDGDTAAAQIIERGGYWGHRFIRIAFRASVPGIGYSMYIVREGDEEEAPEGASQIGLAHVCNYALYERGPEGLENDLVELHLDPVTGGIRQFRDKNSQISIIDEDDGTRPLLRFVEERPRSMSAWQIEHGGSDTDPKLIRLERVQLGPLVATIKATYTVADSKAFLTYRLHHGDPNLYIDLSVEWNERGSAERGTPCLQLAVPTALADATAQYEVPFGAISRDMAYGEEVPALRWAAVTGDTGGKKAGLLLINDSKHGHSEKDGTVRLSLIRSSFEPDSHPEVGNHEIHAALRPIAGTLNVTEAICRGRIFDHSVESIATDLHEGTLEPRAAVIAWSSTSLVLDTVKKSEDNQVIVAKIHNPEKHEGTATLTFDKQVFGTVKNAVESDLMERPIESQAISVADGEISITVPPRGICTALISFD